MRSIRLYPFQQSNIFTCEQMFSLQKNTQRLKVIRVCISGQKKVKQWWQKCGKRRLHFGLYQGRSRFTLAHKKPPFIVVHNEREKSFLSSCPVMLIVFHHKQILISTGCQQEKKYLNIFQLDSLTKYFAITNRTVNLCPDLSTGWGECRQVKSKNKRVESHHKITANHQKLSIEEVFLK